MAHYPIIFAMANPDPEITYEEAKGARADVIVATGRSDYPNQINNVLGFPFIFRGALDVRAAQINEEMKIAAAKALAALAKEPVPYSVMRAYEIDRLEFGPDYIIPKPYDPRVLIWEASAVAKAAMESGVAGKRVDLVQYREKLEERLGLGRQVMRVFINKARKEPKRIVYPEGEHEAILKASEMVIDEGIAAPVLLGKPEVIEEKLANMHLDIFKKVEVINPESSPKLSEYGDMLYDLRKRKGLILSEARKLIRRPTYFGAMMLRNGDADGMVAGITQHYAETIRPALQIIGVRPDVQKVAGFHMLVTRERVYFFADTTVNIEPTAEDIADIATLSAREAQRFGVEPRVALLSYSNFGSVRHPGVEKMRRALQILEEKRVDWLVDGEMQASTAVWPELLDKTYPFSRLAGTDGANVLIFPNLEASNTAYKLVNRIGKVEAVGPVLMGMRKPVHLLQIGDVNEIDVVYMTAIAVVDAQE